MQNLRKKLLVLVKTYPNPSFKYQETVCVAGVTEEKEWIRLYPVPFRSLDEKRFKKYQWIEVDLKESNDNRPFTYKPVLESITKKETLNTSRNWSERKRLVFPLISDSMCSIQKEANDCLVNSSPVIKSLAVFRPKIVEDFIVKPDDPDWSFEQRTYMMQTELFDEKKKPLEKIPFKFYYQYKCEDKNCQGHTQSIIDWELMQLYRKMKRECQSSKEVLQKIKDKWMGELCHSKNDTVFFVGNGFQTPKSFMVLGVFYPKQEKEQFNLFD